MITDKMPMAIDRVTNINILMNLLVSILQLVSFVSGIIILIIGIVLYILAKRSLNYAKKNNNNKDLDELVQKMYRRKKFLNISIIISLILFVLTGIATTQKVMHYNVWI